VAQHGVVTRALAVLAIVCASTTGRAGVVTLDDGNPGDGHTVVRPDDYGFYGIQNSGQDDRFYPPGFTNVFGITLITGAIMTVTTPGNVTSRVLLCEDPAWVDLVEQPPPAPDGIAGAHSGLTRTVTSPIVANGLEATSAFELAHAGSGLDLDVSLLQRLVPSPATVTSDFHQIYTIVNNGSVTVDIVFHVGWETDLYFNDNSFTDDVVGISSDFCSLYTHDPGSSQRGVALGDGGSTVPLSYYYGGKAGIRPGGVDPAMATLAVNQVSKQHVWNAGGVPTTWRNFIAGVGYDTAGEDPTLIADATIGREWRFTIAAGATEKVHVLRRYGSISIPCPPKPGCGNGTVDSGELCDGSDTPTCNGATCSESVCGDGYTNVMAGEACESSGIDSETCNGMLCTPASCGDGYVNAAANELCDDGGESATCNVDCTPAVCGDGYVNAAANEECEGGDLCDTATCTVTFTVGGGCAGCGASGAAGAPLWLAGFIVSARRRRRARAT
jgi:hypothetical protein